MVRPRILAVDDDESFLDAVEIVLDHDYQIARASSGGAALEHLSAGEFACVLLDINLPDMNGRSVLAKIAKAERSTPVIMLTGVSRVDSVVEAVRAGAFDYLTKPLDRDRLLVCVRNAVQKYETELQRARLVEEAKSQRPLIGTSSAICRIRDSIRRVANAEVPVLITGETGVGKDVIARLIHLESDRAGQHYVKISIPNLPETLLESELFGFEKSGFTGADRKKLGLIELAHQGTAFVDEIGLAPLTIQAKLLQVVEYREFIPVGSTQSRRVDVRIITATNKDLLQEIDRGTFLRDLYYRLDGVSIHIPPLRERREDIPLLLEYFIGLKSAQMSVMAKTISCDALACLLEYRWPGNVRELEHLADKLLLMTDSTEIGESDVRVFLDTPALTPAGSGASLLQVGLADREREIITDALVVHNFNISQTAKALGLHRVTLHNKIKSLGIDVKNL